MIIRTAVTFAVCVTLGRWAYAEIETNMPGLTPAVDYVLEATEIPTHDQWDSKKFSKMFQAVGEVKSAFAGERKSSDGGDSGYVEKIRETRNYDRF